MKKAELLVETNWRVLGVSTKVLCQSIENIKQVFQSYNLAKSFGVKWYQTNLFSLSKIGITRISRITL